MASAANSFVRSNEMHAALDRHLPKMAHLTYQGVELPVKWRKLGEGLIAETVEILGRLLTHSNLVHGITKAWSYPSNGETLVKG